MNHRSCAECRRGRCASHSDAASTRPIVPPIGATQRTRVPEGCPMPARPPALLVANNRWLAAGRAPSWMTWHLIGRERFGDPRLLLLALFGAALGWAALAIAIDAPLLAVRAPRAQVSVETAVALCWLFGAIVVLQAADNGHRARRRWVAGGLAALGLGGLGVRIGYPLTAGSTDPNAHLYGMVLVGTAAGGLLAVGFGATKVPAISARLWFAIPAG